MIKPKRLGWAFLILFLVGSIWAFSSLLAIKRNADRKLALLDTDSLKVNPIVSEIYDKKRERISLLSAQRKHLLRIEEIPQILRKAFLVAEDQQFYEHSGINYRAILRAAARNFLQMRIVEGASTITQQATRLFYLDSRRNFDRKIQEWFLARGFERTFSKDAILEYYLNNVYLGELAFGVGAAAKVFFAKTVDELSIAEVAMIAGLASAPTRYSPFLNPSHAKSRQLYVLKRLLDEKIINREDYQNARSQSLLLSKASRFYKDRYPTFSQRFLREMDLGLRARVIHGNFQIETALEKNSDEVCRRRGRGGVKPLFHLSNSWEESRLLLATHRALLLNQTDGDYHLEPIVADWLRQATPLSKSRFYLALVGGRAKKGVQLKVGTRVGWLSAGVSTEGIKVGDLLVVRPVSLQPEVIFEVFEPLMGYFARWNREGHLTHYCDYGITLTDYFFWRNLLATVGLELQRQDFGLRSPAAVESIKAAKIKFSELNNEEWIHWDLKAGWNLQRLLLLRSQNFDGP